MNWQTELHSTLSWILTALSFFRLFYEEFTLYQARLNRLYGFMTKLDELDHSEVHQPMKCSNTLREAICYPDIDPYHPELEKILADCCLDKYLHSLDIDNDWQTILSPGELQRVAFIRILLTKPEVVFLDEITSALDEPTEYLLYKTIKERLPNMIILSVVHRGTLHQFHNKQLDLAVCIV